MKYRVEIITQIQQWPKVEQCSYFNSTHWASLFQQEQNAQPLLAVVYDQNHQLQMIQNALISKSIKQLPGKWGTACVLWGPPQLFTNKVDKTQLYLLLIKELIRYSTPKAFLLEARNFPENITLNSTFNTLHFKPLPWTNVINEISDTKQILKSISERRARQIKAALHKGATIVTQPTLRQWEDFYQILTNHYKKIHRPLPTFSPFKQLLQQPDAGFCVIILTPQEKVIAGMACLFHHSNTAYAWYAAGLDKDPSYSHFHPSILANYGALIHAQQLGATIFDFQGAGLRDKSSGVRQFKLRFGGTLTNTFRYRKLLWF